MLWQALAAREAVGEQTLLMWAVASLCVLGVSVIIVPRSSFDAS